MISLMKKRRVTKQYDPDEEETIAELRYRLEKLEQQTAAGDTDIDLPDGGVHWSTYEGKPEQFMRDLPECFYYDGLFYLLCTKIHDDEYFVCYKVASQSIPNKGACNIQLVYLFKKLSRSLPTSCLTSLRSTVK